MLEDQKTKEVEGRDGTIFPHPDLGRGLHLTSSDLYQLLSLATDLSWLSVIISLYTQGGCGEMLDVQEIEERHGYRVFQEKLLLVELKMNWTIWIVLCWIEMLVNAVELLLQTTPGERPTPDDRLLPDIPSLTIYTNLNPS